MSRLSLSLCFAISLIFGTALASLVAASNAVTAGAATAPVSALAPPTGMSGVVMPAPVLPADPTARAMIARGQYLTIAGDCSACHTVSGQAPLSGGYAVDTPVGTIYSPNITPSKQYGIGNWTDAQFYAALHEGVRPGHSLLVFPAYLFPVMPYTAYSKLSYADVMAIKAYLDATPPVDNPNRPMTVPFPFNIRAGQLAWRIPIFRATPMQYDPGWSASVRNGAYLVQALAHCSECHTPRNIAMASETSKYLGGGKITAQSWYAPNISSSARYGVGGWSDDAMTQYLRGGGDMVHGAPFGPMQQVVNDSLSRLPETDVRDIVAYLRTVPAQQTPPPAMADTAATPAAGSVVYAANCARCHGVNGAGVANNFPNLAANQAISDGAPENAISMVLGGFQPWHPNQSAMPAFDDVLSDEEIAAVTNYIRTSWGNTGAADATGDAVERLRAVTTQEVALDAGTMQAVLNDAGTAQNLTNISGTFEFNGSRTNCQIDANLGGDDPAKTIHLAGACTDAGFTLHGTATAAGKAMPVDLALRDAMQGNYVGGVTLDGDLGDGRHLSGVIRFLTPND